ncbi:DMAC1 protein, partial [Piaya cayana]|nr:DMAC1 protein [Piaya cayana]
NEMAGGAEEAPVASGAAGPRPLFGGCWSCRLVCGAGLLAAALWLYQGPRRSMKAGIAPNMAAVAQITLAVSERRHGN